MHAHWNFCTQQHAFEPASDFRCLYTPAFHVWCYHVLSYAVPFICIAALQDLNVQQLTFCLQGVLTANPPVRTAQAGTFCSHSTSPSLPICHLFRHPSKSRFVFLFNYWFVWFQIRYDPTIGLLSQRHSRASLVSGTGNTHLLCFSPTDGITYPALLSSWHMFTDR